jgi:hypothetical protein
MCEWRFSNKERAPRLAFFAEIGTNIKFSTDRLESYCLSAWEPVIFDALLVAGVVEYCDRVQKRPALAWGRHFELTIAVHESDRLERYRCRHTVDR